MNIITYGSLMNQKSLEKTLQRDAKLLTITLPKANRIFNAPFGDYAFLNLELGGKDSIEAAYFELDKNEIEKFSEREKDSELIEVVKGMYAFVWPAAYCRELPVLQSYIDVCESGCRDLGIDLWSGMKMPQKIIDDSRQPLYQ